MSEQLLVESACSDSDISLILEASKLTSHLPGAILEIGSYKCAMTMLLAKEHPWRMVFAFDLFGGNPYPERDTFAHLANVDLETVAQQVAHFPNIRLVRGMHEETIPKFPPMPIAFLFVDSDWGESHEIALKYLAPRVLKGGIIAFHDWCFGCVQTAAYKNLDPDEWEEVCNQFEYRHPEQGIMFLRRK
jgi:hypothetical protein